MTYHLEPSALERDVKKKSVIPGRPRAEGSAGGAGSLTGPLGSDQVLAFRLVGIDGRDGHRVLRVRVQVLQNVRVLIAVQDFLLRTEPRNIPKLSIAANFETVQCT